MADNAIDRFRFHFRRVLFEKNRRPGEVAISAGLSPAWASSLKKGAGVSLAAVDAIAHELGIDLSEFFGPQTFHASATPIVPPAEPATDALDGLLLRSLLENSPGVKAAIVNVLLARRVPPPHRAVPPPVSVSELLTSIPPSITKRPTNKPTTKKGKGKR